MARHHMTPDGPVPFTAEEEAARDAEEAARDAEETAWEAEQATNGYKAKRAAEYPPIGDQLDALWKGGEAAAAMLAQVQAVKAKYPKP